MAINKKITELATKVPETGDIFIVADDNTNYQLTLKDISGALAGAGAGSTSDTSSYAHFSDFSNNKNGAITVEEYDSTNNILQKVLSDDFSDFKVYLNWDGPGSAHWQGTGYIEGQQIPDSNVSAVGTTRVFRGFRNGLNSSTFADPLFLSGEANGVSAVVPLEILGLAPDAHTVLIDEVDQSSTATTSTLYPGDKINILAWFDLAGRPIGEQPYQFRVAPPNEYGTTQGNLGANDLVQETSWQSWTGPWSPAINAVPTSHPTDPTLSGIYIEGTVLNVSDSTIEHGARIQCKNAYGKIGNAVHSYGDDGAGNLLGGSATAFNWGTRIYHYSHQVGAPPSVTIGAIEYPGQAPSGPAVTTTPYDQQALKGSETALVENTVLNYATVFYSSPNGELDIENPNSYEAFKKVICTAPGVYNVTSDNFRITATKGGQTATENARVNIADKALTLTIPNDLSKLKSKPGGKNWTFALQSDQLQLQAPELEADPTQSPLSALTRLGPSSTSLTGNNFTIKVKDSDGKGVFSWDAIEAVNLAGKATGSVSPPGYNIAGFINREVTASGLDPWKGLYPIGTTVTDPNNVTFYSDSISANLSFYDLGSGFILKYTFGINFIGHPDNTGNQNTGAGNLAGNLFCIVTTNNPDTMLATELTVDPNGDHLFILDSGIRSMNSFGAATGDIEES